MSRTIVSEWQFWIGSIFTGACMAFVYDLLRLLRRLVRHGRIAVDLEDILYWTACFFASFSLLYYGNNGVIRFAAVFGAAAGMALYAVTVGRIFVKYMHLLLDKTIGSLLRFIGKIAVYLRRRMVFAVRRLGHFAKKLLTKVPIHHKIVIQRKKAAGKEEAGHGRNKKKKKKKDTNVSAV